MSVPPFEAWLFRIGFAVGVGLLFWMVSTQMTEDVRELIRRFREWRKRRKARSEEMKDG